MGFATLVASTVAIPSLGTETGASEDNTRFSTRSALKMRNGAGGIPDTAFCAVLQRGKVTGSGLISISTRGRLGKLSDGNLKVCAIFGFFDADGVRSKGGCHSKEGTQDLCGHQPTASCIDNPSGGVVSAHR